MNIYEPSDDLVPGDVVSTLSLVPYKLSTVSPKLNMFNSVEFV